MESSGVKAAAGISLQHLADMAIGPAVVGTVNFPALHTLLHAIIQHLHIQDVVVLRGSGSCQSSGDILVKEEPDGQEDRMSPRILHIEKQLETLNNIPCRAEALEDTWKMMRLSGRLEVTEEGVSKAMAVLQDVMLEVNILKDAQREVQNHIQREAETAGLETSHQLEQRHSDGKPEMEMESLQIEVELLKTQMKELEEKFEVFHKTLARHPDPSNQGAQMSLTSQLNDDDISPMSGPTQAAENVVSDGPILDASHTTLPQAQRSSEAEDSAHPVQTPHVTEDAITASTLEDTQIEVSGQRHETNLTYPETSTPQNTTINLSRTNMGTTAAPGSPGVTLAPPTGVTTNDHAMLYTRVDALERDKADRSELGLLQKNIDDLSLTLHDLLSNLNREMQGLRGGTDKLDQLHKAMEPAGTSQYSDHKLEEPSLNATIQEIEKELWELHKIQKQEKATIEQSEADKPQYLQNQDGELISHIEKTMSQLQEECEQLARTTGSLIRDHEQNQRLIDILYQTAENLDMKKLDQGTTGLEVDVKVDERVFGSKVSRTHFDATTEHLSRMVQELLGKVNAQEQDWQRLLEKINVEMQNKLDRIELEPLRNILEQCWRDLHRQLHEHPSHYEADKAAGVRKQLMRTFHCISCNRPVDMGVPGSEMLTIPNVRGLPAHPSNRPYTVFELDQVRQQCRSDRFPQFNDFGYVSSTRNCGGIHTLTFPQRRCARLQDTTPCTTVQNEDFVGGLKEEVFILGQDGNIYRGRSDNHLPPIRPKGGKRSTVAYQTICDCNVKGKNNFLGYSSALASDIHYGLSKAHVRPARGSEQPLPSVKDNIPPTCYQRTKAT